MPTKNAVLLLTGSLLFAMMTSVAQSSKTTLETTMESFKKALVDADSSTLDRLTDNKLSYGHSSGKVEDKRAFIQALVSGQSDFISIETDSQTVDLRDKTAIVRHILRATTSDGGKKGEVKLAVLMVWLNQNKQWKLWSRQAGRYPQ